MNKYLNHDMIAEALATGTTPDEIAEEMTKALNEALAAKRAKEEAAKKANVLAEAEKAVTDATTNYMRLLLDAEGLSAEFTESDWERLRADSAQSLAGLREMVSNVAAFTKMFGTSTPAATKEQKTVKNPIEAFLAANGL